MTISRRALLASGAAGAVVAATERPAVAVTMPPSKGELLIRGASVVSMDPQVGVVANCDIHVRDGAIVAIGPHLTAPSATVIDASQMIAMPGLVDAHNHLWNTMERSIIRESAGVAKGYFAITRALGQKYMPSDTYHSVLLGAAELLSSGVTTVNSWSHNLITPEYANADIRGLRDAGIRARFSYGSYQGGPAPEVPIDLPAIEKLANNWAAHSNGGLITLGVASRSPNFVAKGPITIDTLKTEWAFARKLGLPITVHSQIPGMMENLDKLGILGPDVQLVHPCNWTPADVDAVAKTKATACSAPTTDTRMYFGPIPLRDITKRDITLAMSIDTAGVTGSMDLFTEIRAMYANQNTTYKAEDGITPMQLLQIATINGAKALGLGDKTGSLTVGKRADIILLRSDDLNMAPVADPVEAIVRSARPHNVDTVIVDGAIVRRNGRFTHLDEKKVVADAVAAFNAVKARAGVS